MSGGQSSSTGTELGALDIASLFAPCRRAPKPHSDFPEVPAAMYNTFLATWHSKVEKFNESAARSRSAYENAPAEYAQQNYRIVTVFSGAIEIVREMFEESLDQLEDDLVSWGDESDQGYDGVTGN